MSKPFPRQSLSDKVFQHLRAQLANRTRNVGDKLIARRVAAELGVSRTTVTTAIERLLEEGLVKIDESRHPVVAALPVRLKIHDSQEFEYSNQTDSTYEVLLEKILRGDFGIGEIVKERPIAMQLGVNVATLRRAAEWLSADGLLERLPRRGWRVTLLSLEDIKDIYLVRIFLESTAIRETVRWISEQDLDGLEEDTERLIDLGESATAYDRRDAECRFHRKICQASGSRILTATLEPLIRKVILVATISFRYGHVAETFQEHKAILEALRKRDEKEAVKRIKAHLRDGMKFTTDMWRLR